jgi:hypothetical protein
MKIGLSSQHPEGWAHGLIATDDYEESAACLLREWRALLTARNPPTMATNVSQPIDVSDQL